jgi:uncharacterized metal-binding protein YceD (DUF177 family)
MSFDIEYFAIEFVKLQDGKHQFDYQLNSTFFEHFDNHDIQEAELTVELDIERNGNLMIADLFTSGIIFESCDRCLSKIGLPIESEFKIIYHLNSNHENNENEIKDLTTDVIYLNPVEFKINISQAVYESSLMALPMIKNCDDLEVKPCDEAMLKKIEHINQGETQVDPRWEKLKTIIKK